MTKLAYLECPTGISGDMCLGAIADMGVPLDYLMEQLDRLGISKEYQIRVEKVHRNGQQATKVFVDVLPSDLTVHATLNGENSPRAEYHDHSHSTELLIPTSDGEQPSSNHEHSHPHPHTHDHLHTHSHHPISQTSNHHPTPPERNLPQIEQLIRRAQLPPRVETWSLAIFRQLAEAEAAVHGIPPEQVHFHEVGATDAIVDIVGTCIGLDWLGIDRIYCSPLPVGGGVIRAAHGRLPVPAPAVLKLFELRQVPLYSNGIERELVTPTGAAIATTLATQFGPPPSMTLYRVGLGAGACDLPLPNILRLWVGEKPGGEMGKWRDEKEEDGKRKVQTANLADPTPHSHTPHPTPLEPITVLETQIDDLNPQAIGYVFEALFQAGAVDVFTQAIAMKKSRPGILLTVICHPEAVATCETVLFRETTTLGIRRSTQQRRILRRELQQVQTEYGVIRVKLAWAEGDSVSETLSQHTPINVQPEYEDCAQIARQHHLPWREVHRLALEAWYRGMGNRE